MRIHTQTAILLTALLVVSCAAQKPLVTPAEIASAEDNGVLDGLYNHVKSGLVGKDRNNKKDAALFAQLDAIGRKLTNQLDDELHKQIESARLHNGIVPLNVLTDTQAAAEPMRTWNPARHDMFVKEIGKNRAVTEKAIRDINSYIANLPPTAFRKHMSALSQLAQVSGETRYVDQRESMLRNLRGEFEQARNTDDFEKALQLLDALPEDDQTEPMRIELQARLSERRFNEALADDRPDEAYRYFDTLAKSPYFAEIKARIEPTANQMAEYFVALAADAVSANRISDAYRWFAQARDVHRKLDGHVNPLPEEKVFVDRIYRGHDAAKTQGLWGLALGHLLLVQEFDPARANLARDLSAAETEIGKAAIRNTSIAPFASVPAGADYSGAIATRITDMLFRSIPNDVRIIAFDPVRNTGGDYTITGSIDEARVESSETTTRKTTRAVTEAGALVRNPQYDEWLKLPERQRRSIAQPVAQLTEDKKEDISYNVVELRKVGYFSVAFRVIETATGKVIYTDSLPLKRELTDTGNEGVALGAFQLEAKAPKLPADIEILNQLAAEAAEEVGKRLSKQLGDLEKRHADAGKKAAANNNPVEAAQNYGISVLIAQRKGIDAEPYRAELKRQASAAGYAR